MVVDRTLLIVTSPEFPGRDSQCEPITVGVPLPAGRLRGPARLALADDNGAQLPLQVRPTEFWPDGSVRWALLHFQVTGPAVSQRSYELQVRIDADPPAQRPGLAIRESRDRIVVDTGPARFVMALGDVFPFAQATVNGKPALRPEAGGLIVCSDNDDTWRANVTSMSIEERGPLWATVRLYGTIGFAAQPFVEVIARLQFFTGSAAVRMAITLRNPRRARHPIGYWELGDDGSIYMRDASLALALPAAASTIECATETAAPFVRYGDPFEIYQDSSGGENWRSVVHVNRDNQVPCAFRGYRMTSGTIQRWGQRATPAVMVKHGSGATGIAVEHFWQNFPKAIEVQRDLLHFRLFPEQWADVHELQGGEQKTHHFTVMFGDDAMACDARFWGRSRAIAAASPKWYSTTRSVACLSAADDDKDTRYRELVNRAIEGPTSFEAKREIIDEYGWRHFGEIYADHEQPFSGSVEPIVSHYNNQYDGIGGLATQFMRTGDPRWWHRMSELAAHVADIDIYHTDNDKAAYNHGLFWHTYHYVPAGRSTHRSYPRRLGVSGGGPANEHNYTAGLRLHWLLTGDRQSRDAALELARWVIDMDDGRKTPLRWVTAADTGRASATREPGFHGPGRGAAYSILALMDGHRLTVERRYLDKAESLIRRCIHPKDDVATRNLLQAEKRWSYTVFLQALGKYLEYKAELDEFDVMYSYARDALVHYARWMLDHEYPYLEKPELLEYPTETWAAQDMRKSEVFYFAARHTSGADHDRFIERGQSFFDYSVSMLATLETGTLARPLVLLLSNGFMHFGYASMPELPRLPDETVDFGPPLAFVHQKAIARVRLAIAALLIITTAAMTAGYYTLFWWRG